MKFLEKTMGKYVIIRSYSSGVHFGILKEYDPVTRSVVLGNTRRLWRWRQFTLTEIAKYGNHDADNKTSEEIEEMFVCEVVEIIPCTDVAIDNLKNAKAYDPY